MFVKKFEASTLDKALSLVRETLGPDALILSTQEIKGRLFQKGSFEVTAAFDDSSQSTPIHDEKVQQTVSFEGTYSKSKQMASDRYQTQDVSTIAEPISFEKIERRFLDTGMDENTAKDLARRILFEYSREDLSSESFLNAKAAEVLANTIHCYSYELFEARPSWVALGNPGAGKTSFLVKLALSLIKRSQKVSLVSLDKRKLIGQKEMAEYSKLLGASSKGAGNTLIEAPAFPLGAKEEAELEAYCEGRSCFVVLDATGRKRELLAVIQQAEKFSPKAVVFTKLDLCARYGLIYDILRETRLPLLGTSSSSSFKTGLKFLSNLEVAGLVLRREGR